MSPLAPPRPRGARPAGRRPAAPAGPTPAPAARMTEAEFLAYERDPARALEPKSELFAGGEVREMPGVSFAHGRVVTALEKAVDRFLDEDRFERVSSDIRFRPPACRFFYPDLMVAPNPPLALDEERDVLLNPVFVAEVSSDSTASTDRGEKQTCYLNTPSVLEYWLVAQDRVRVERHHRPAAGAAWGFDAHEDRGGEVPLPALGGAVSLAALYRQVVPAG